MKSRTAATILVLVVSTLLVGCAAAPWIINDLTGTAVGMAAGAATDAAIAAVANGKVKVLESKMQKLMMNSNIQYHGIRITGTFKYIPAKVGSDLFVDLSRTFFVFQLLDAKGKKMTYLSGRLDLEEGALLESIEANKLYRFVLQDNQVPKNRWDRIVSHKFDSLIQH